MPSILLSNKNIMVKHNIHDSYLMGRSLYRNGMRALDLAISTNSITTLPLLYSANSRNTSIFRNMNIGVFVKFLDSKPFFPNVATRNIRLP